MLLIAATAVFRTDRGRARDSSTKCGSLSVLCSKWITFHMPGFNPNNTLVEAMEVKMCATYC
jgi:hypothetical protein